MADGKSWFVRRFVVVGLGSLALGTLAVSCKQPSGVACTRFATATKLEVTSGSFGEGVKIPEHFSGYSDNVSPQISWKGAPSGTKSFVVMVEDPDAHSATPYLHWIVTDLPADMTAIPEHAATVEPKPAFLKGGVQGENSAFQAGYLGPRPPSNDGPHHYHFAVLALDARLGLPGNYDRGAAMKAMSGHVLACGETVATYEHN